VPIVWYSDKLHRAGPFSRGRQLCSYSRTFQNFMGPEGRLPCSQEHSTGSSPELHQPSPYHPIISPHYPLSTLLRFVLPSSHFPFNVPNSNIFSPIRFTCPVHLIVWYYKKHVRSFTLFFFRILDDEQSPKTQFSSILQNHLQSADCHLLVLTNSSALNVKR
jgi:hypothetical protein